MYWFCRSRERKSTRREKRSTNHLLQANSFLLSLHSGPVHAYLAYVCGDIELTIDPYKLLLTAAQSHWY